jgi:hypothetical protein
MRTAAFLLLLTACAAGDESQQQADADGEAPAAEERIVACELLPPTDVTDVMGLPIQRTEPREVDSSDGSTTRYLTGCTYIAEDGDALRTASILLTRGPEITDPAAALQRFVEGMQADMPGYQLEPVPELGPGGTRRRSSSWRTALVGSWWLASTVVALCPAWRDRAHWPAACSNVCRIIEGETPRA